MALRDDVIIRFGGDSRGVNSTLAGIRASVSGLGSMLAGLGVGVGLASITSAIRETLNWADDLGNTAKRIGLTSEAVQTLRLQAEHYGVSQEQVDDSLTKFALNLAKAQQGTGDLLKVTDKYSISLKDTQGNLRSTEAVLGDYIKLLQGGANEQEKVRIGVAGMGKGAAEFAQAMAESGVPLDQTIAKLKEMGLIMDDQGVKKLADLEERWTTFTQRLGMASKQALLGTVTFFDELSAASSKFLDETKEAAARLVSLQERIDAVRQEAARLTTQINRPDTNSIGEWWYNRQLTIALRQLNALIDQQRALAKPPVPGPAATQGPVPTTGNASGVGSASADFAKYVTSITKTARTETAILADIWAAYGNEAQAVRKGDEDAAAAAQAKQEELFRSLDPKKNSAELMAQYAKLVGEMADKPIETTMKVKVDRTEIDGIPTLFAATMAVTPVLQWGGEVPGETPPIRLPADQGIAREADKTGANP